MLLRETGKYLVQHVHEQASRVRGVREVVVATDDETIRDAVESFGGVAIMTSPDHPSGTDRAAEVARLRPAEIIVNVQGDEPELEPADVEALIAGMGALVQMATLCHAELSEADQNDPAVVKAVIDEDGWAIDFRREPTPGAARHLGVYAYRAEMLQRITKLAPTANEKARRLEQMRVLDHGGRIRAVQARHCGTGIDTPEDYAAFVRRTRPDGVRS